MPNISRFKSVTPQTERPAASPGSPLNRGVKETTNTDSSTESAVGGNKNIILILVAVGALFLILKKRKK